MPIATVKQIQSVEELIVANDPSKWATGPREDFNLYQAGNSAIAYGGAGAGAGFYLGCAILGAISAGFGCLAGAEIGYEIGGIGGGVIGFFIGGHEIAGYDALDALPNELYLPRPR